MQIPSVALAADDTSLVTSDNKDYTFCSYETSIRDYTPRRWRFAASTAASTAGDPQPPDLDEVADDEKYLFTSIQGKEYSFRKYVSNCDSSSLRLDFCLETPNGVKK
jgi:hypothetical protein